MRTFALSALLLVGCELADQLDKLGTVKFDLPMTRYTFSTMDPRWKQPPADGVPQVPCGPGGVTMDCCSFSNGPSIDCSATPLTCEAGTCALKFLYTHATLLDLAKDSPSLRNVGNGILTQVVLKELRLDISSMLNVALPPVDVYVAPAGVTTPGAPRTQKIATVEALTAGFQGVKVIPLTPEAQRAFSEFATDFKTPFNLLVSTTVLFTGGPPPMGMVRIDVGGQVDARF